MELYLQVGAGMMKHSKCLFEEWGGGTAILSPRDLDPGQLLQLSHDLKERQGTILCDPQFYSPRGYHHKLALHGYWPQKYDTDAFAVGGRQILVENLAELNRQLRTTYMIVPGERADSVTPQWLDSQRAYWEAACQATEKPLVATTCLGSDVIRSQEQIALIMEQAERLPVLGHYLILERPGGTYLTDDSKWVANALDLAAGLKRLGAAVIIGFSSHQQLIMSCAAVNAIASGTFRNVRTFSLGRYRSSTGSQPRRRGTWYYCPQAMTEYKLDALDRGVERGLKDLLYPDIPAPQAVPLFLGQQPTASGWNESDSHRHYLMSLHQQARSLTRSTFDETVAAYRSMLDRAEDFAKLLRDEGILGQDRDFQAALTANRDALVALENTQGPVLRRSWTDLIS